MSSREGMRLPCLSAFPLLAFLPSLLHLLNLLHLVEGRQGNKPRDKLQLRPKPRAQEVSSINFSNICQHHKMPFHLAVSQSADPTEGKVKCLTFASHFSHLGSSTNNLDKMSAYLL